LQRKTSQRSKDEIQVYKRSQKNMADCLMCKVLEVNRSGYYSWLKIKATKQSKIQAKLLEQINYYYEKSRKLYGSPRITRELRSCGIKVNVKTVARIIRINNLQAKTVKRFKRTTKASTKGKFNPNFLVNINYKNNIIFCGWLI